MRSIKTFESFSQGEYLWPEAKFWIEELYPEEVCFLSMYSDIYSSKWRKEKPFFRLESTPGGNELEDENDGTGEGKIEFFITLEIPTKDGEYCFLEIEAKAFGRFTPYVAGTFYDPPEGGESILEGVEVKGAYYNNPSGDIDINFLDKTYKFQSDIINYDLLISLMEFLAYFKVSASEEDMDIEEPKIPEELIKKCENIREKIPELAKGSRLISRIIK
jgi:hypothetical protein